MYQQHIGVFDSGKGGLTVLQELKKILPFESFIYFGDIANLPFGSKTHEQIIEINRQTISFLIANGVKLIVLACNTSSAIAINTMKQEFPDTPIIGIIGPGANQASSITKNRRIGVFATQATISSHIYQKTINSLNPGIKVIEKACPNFVPIVENNLINTPAAAVEVANCMKIMLEENVDTLIHGCTHYPYLEDLMRQNGPNINYVNPAAGAASLTKSTLQELDLFTINKDPKTSYLISNYEGGNYVRADGREYFLSSAPAYQKQH